MFKQIRQKVPAKLLVRIDLNDHKYAIKALKKRRDPYEKAFEFVSEKLLELEPCLELKLLRQCCEQKHKVGIVIMLLVFEKSVRALNRVSWLTAVEQLCVTTRPHLREKLGESYYSCPTT
jgi:hypothetical protein